jgi:phenylalanyl-tRNA synthetase beta chain
MAKRLKTIGVATINNVVDITNYVLMECGQPLHAFDFAKIAGGQIVVRRAKKNEPFAAINHRDYQLDETMCVIADARGPVALAGVMGGADTEVSESTVDVLIESADFDPMSVRSTARKLVLHSDSSYRFERGVDPEGVIWASRRAAELILELAGGELASGVVDVGEKIAPRSSITLPFSELKRILGIDVPAEEARRILLALGATERNHSPERIEITPPSWRRDLTRPIDLVEEVARIHGYDKIPEDVAVPMVAPMENPLDHWLDATRRTLSACGFDEAITSSAVGEDSSSALSPWTDAEPLRSSTAVLRSADCLRRSLIPSLLEVRKTNESLSNEHIELYEIASVYLPRNGSLPDERRMAALCSGGDVRHLKGAIENVVSAVCPAARLGVEPLDEPLAMLEPGESGRLTLDGKPLGLLGRLSAEGRKRFDLRGAATVAELDFQVLAVAAQIAAPYRRPPAYPSIERDLNLVVDNAVRWADLAETVRGAADSLLERLDYVDVYRNEKDPQLGKSKKSVLLSLVLRDAEQTLTGQQADAVRDAVVAAAAQAHGAELRS